MVNNAVKKLNDRIRRGEVVSCRGCYEFRKVHDHRNMLCFECWLRRMDELDS